MDNKGKRTEIIRVWTYSENKNTIRVSYEKRNFRYSEKYKTEVFTTEKIHPRSKEAKKIDKEILMVNEGRNKNYGLTFSGWYNLAYGALIKTLQMRERMDHHMKVKHLAEPQRQAYYVNMMLDKYVL